MFGVGLKDALAVLHRNGVQVVIRTRHGHSYTLEERVKIGFNDKTLHIKVQKEENLIINTNISDTTPTADQLEPNNNNSNQLSNKDQSDPFNNDNNNNNISSVNTSIDWEESPSDDLMLAALSQYLGETQDNPKSTDNNNNKSNSNPPTTSTTPSTQIPSIEGFGTYIELRGMNISSFFVLSSSFQLILL